MGAESEKKAHLTVDLREPSFNVSTSWRRPAGLRYGCADLSSEVPVNPTVRVDS